GPLLPRPVDRGRARPVAAAARRAEARVPQARQGADPAARRDAGRRSAVHLLPGRRRHLVLPDRGPRHRGELRRHPRGARSRSPAGRVHRRRSLRARARLFGPGRPPVVAGARQDEDGREHRARRLPAGGRRRAPLARQRPGLRVRRRPPARPVRQPPGHAALRAARPGPGAGGDRGDPAHQQPHGHRGGGALAADRMVTGARAAAATAVALALALAAAAPAAAQSETRPADRAVDRPTAICIDQEIADRLAVKRKRRKVVDRLFVKQARHELSLVGGAYVSDLFSSTYALGASYTYHMTENTAVEMSAVVTHENADVLEALEDERMD